jgi:uncharacterized membrane protein YidH (DUF202 family)
MEQFGRVIIVLGVVLVVFGLLLAAGGRFNLGRLPGDIVIKKENFSFYFPLMTGIVLSIVLTVVLQLFNRFFR